MSEPDLAIVVPSASSVAIVRITLPALVKAGEAAGLRPHRITVVDDRPGREGLGDLTRELGTSYIETRGGTGPGAARNLGAQSCSNAWLCFVDDDVELDRGALVSLVSVLPETESVGHVGGLRPPASSPAWLRWAYMDGTITTASAFLSSGSIPATALSTAACAIRNDTFHQVGGFPVESSWGLEDTVMGVRLVASSDGTLWREPAFGGVHHYVPSWSDWLIRNHRAGRRLRQETNRLPAPEADALRAAFGVSGPRRWRKCVAGLIPPPLRPPPLTRFLARLATASAFMDGYRSDDLRSL